MKLLLLVLYTFALFLVQAVQENITEALFENQKSLPVNFFAYQNLLVLVIKKCGLTKLDGDKFKDLQTLKELKVTRNNLDVLNGSEFTQLVSLEVLNLKINNISKIPSNEFSSLRLLRRLYLEENCLKSIDKSTFADNVRLEVLSLSHNDISKLHYKTFTSLSKLRDIDLSLNKLTSLQADLFINNVNLERIHLYRNNLHHIDTLIFQSLTKLLKADFEGNPCMERVGFIQPTDIQKLNETIFADCAVTDEIRVEWLTDEVQELKSKIIELQRQQPVQPEIFTEMLLEVQTTTPQVIPERATNEKTDECSAKNELLQNKVTSLEGEVTELKIKNKINDTKDKAGKESEEKKLSESSGDDDDENCPSKLENLQHEMNECEEKLSNCSISHEQLIKTAATSNL